jgi:hypothetical protein
VVDPVSHPIPRVGWYSRKRSTPAQPPSPTGLSPPAVGPSSAVRIKAGPDASTRYRAPCVPFYPAPAARTRSSAGPVWAPPVSLAATPGILSAPRGTEMFQFPRCPHRDPPVSSRFREGVAPFGNPWITRCQHVPRAFRGVAASFLGSRRLGIHRALIIVDLAAPTRAIGYPAPARDAPPRPEAGMSVPHLARTRTGAVDCDLRWSRGDSNPGPPPCKGGALPAKLRPPVRPRPRGRAWTRTRDLGLIRTAL